MDWCGDCNPVFNTVIVIIGAYWHSFDAVSYKVIYERLTIPVLPRLQVSIRIVSGTSHSLRARFNIRYLSIGLDYCYYYYKSTDLSDTLHAACWCTLQNYKKYSARRRSRRTYLTHFEIFRRRVVIFSLFFLRCFYFPLKVHVNFSSVFCREYRTVVTSCRHRPFCIHNFVFLLNCLFVLYILSEICNRQPEFLCALLL